MSGTDCSHRKRAKATDGSISCTECGTIVIEASGLIPGAEDGLYEGSEEGKYLDLRHTQRPILSPLSLPVRQLHELVRGLCRALGLSSSLAERAIILLDVALERRLINRGETGRRAAGALIYWLARGTQSGKGDAPPLPLTVREVAALLGVSQTEMAPSLEVTKGLVEKTYEVKIMPAVDPALYVEKLASVLGLWGETTVMRKAMVLCNLCQEKFSLTAGRKPEAIAMACLLISGLSTIESAEEPLVVGRPVSWRQHVRVLSERVGLASDTVILRCNEIRDALVQEARQLPFGVPEKVKLGRDTVDGLLDDILRHCRLKGDSSEDNKANPPAYEESVIRRRMREEQVQRALKRLFPSEGSNPTPTALTFEEVLIERLLLHNVPREHIEQATSLHQLLSLEEGYTINEDDVASDDEEIIITDNNITQCNHQCPVVNTYCRDKNK